MTYKLYKDQLDIFGSSSTGRREIKKFFESKKPSYDEFLKVMSRFVLKSPGSSGLLSLYAEEANWHDLGCPTIFFEDELLVNSLCMAKFDFDNNFDVEPPIKTFAMSFPSNTVIAGVELATCLVTIMTRDEFEELYANKIPERPILLQRGNYTGNELCIAINCPSSNGRYNDREFSHIENFTENMKYNQTNKLPGNSTEILSSLAKIALAMCVYNSANNGEKLVPGFPSSSIKIPSGKTKVGYKGLVMGSDAGNSTPAKDSRKIKFRVAHYRNLKADRYYQNEHSNKKKGSRWILVKAYDPDEIASTLKK